MIIDLISTSNYISFNIRLAHVLGLTSSIYLSEIININEKAIRKDKIEDDYFKLDRSYITQRTTLSIDDQKEIESKLKKLKIINKKDSDLIKIDLSVLTSIIMSSDEDLVKDISNIAKTKKETTRVNAIKTELKSYIQTSNAELRDSYSEWIDSVFAKQGWMSKRSVTVAQTTIDNYCNHDLDEAIELLNIASINGYRDIQWAINVYEERNLKKSSYTFGNKSSKEKIELGDQVF